MNKKDYIGIDLAKHLHEKGFDRESRTFIYMGEKIKTFIVRSCVINEDIYKTYSYYQILTSLAMELFGDRLELGYTTITAEILQMVQQNKPQELIDEYIKSNLIDKWK